MHGYIYSNVYHNYDYYYITIIPIVIVMFMTIGYYHGAMAKRRRAVTRILVLRMSMSESMCGNLIRIEHSQRAIAMPRQNEMEDATQRRW